MISNPENQPLLGNYRLLRYLGGGGFADVYLGEHIHLERQAAIKVLKLQNDQHAYDSFRAEARRVAALRHSHIISVLDFGIERNMPFLVMDYAPHGTLRDRHPRSSRVALPIVVNYVQQVASALHYAHQQKLIHRDVKPANMLVGANDDILLSDFGISVVAHRTETLTPQEALGTLMYTAPEQLQGRARPESDQYSLAISVYEWLSGTPPFTGSSSELISQHLYSAPLPLRERLPDLPSVIDTILLKALAKAPQQRFPTILDFAHALREAGEGRLRLHGNASPYTQTELDISLSPRASQLQEISPAPDTRQFPQEPAPAQPIVNLHPSNEDTDRPLADPAENVHTSSQSIDVSFERFFSAAQEKIQLALVIEQRPAWEAEVHKQRDGQAALADIEGCYVQGLRERTHRNIEKAVLWWLQGIALNPGYNNGIFIKVMKEDLQKLLLQHLTILRNRLEQARQGNNLEQEMKFLEDMQALDPRNRKLGEQLSQARQDKLQTHDPAFRHLPALREQIILSLNNRVRQAMDDRSISRCAISFCNLSRPRILLGPSSNSKRLPGISQKLSAKCMSLWSLSLTPNA